MMENPKHDFFKEYSDKVESYIDDRILLLRLTTVKKISTLIVQLVAIAFMALLVAFIVLFISIMLGFFLGDVLNNYYAGFGIITLLFILAFVLAIAYRKQLARRFVSSIIDIILDKKEHDD